MEKLHTYNNVSTALDFINNPEDSESKLAFETAIGDMENELPDLFDFRMSS